jgi:hypothetical protein
MNENTPIAEFKLLPQKKTKNGCYYNLIQRTKDVAIYDQAYSPDGKIIGYEVFKIILWPEHTMPNGEIQPVHEKFPSDEDFGETAWAYCTKEAAMVKFQELVEKSMLKTA